MNTPLIVSIGLALPMFLSCIPPWEQSEYGPEILAFESVAALYAAVFAGVAAIVNLITISSELKAMQWLLFSFVISQIVMRFIRFSENEYKGVFAMVAYGLLTLSIPGKIIFAVIAAAVTAGARLRFNPNCEYSKTRGRFFGLQKFALTSAYTTLLLLGLSWYSKALNLAAAIAAFLAHT